MTRRVAVVTGAAGGIGREIVSRLVGAGVSTAVIDKLDSTSELVGLSTAQAGVLPLVVDVLDADACIAAVRHTIDELGAIDILVNAAGVMHKAPLAEHSIYDWDLEFGVNARAAFIFCREIVPEMAHRGTGTVVNIGSIWGHRGGPHRVAYIAAKHAMIGLTRALASEFGPGVRINSISPGPVRTPMTEKLGGDQSAWLDPGEVADVVAFLCGSGSIGITGTDVEVYGRGRPAGL